LVKKAIFLFRIWEKGFTFAPPAEGEMFLNFTVIRVLQNNFKNSLIKICVSKKNAYFCTRFENESEE
jgi:hypothetical protein